MLKRLLLSGFIAVAVCGTSFYLAYFAGLIYSAATGPLNPANTQTLQSVLRHVALPVCIVLGGLAFVVAFRGFARRSPEKKSASAGSTD